ncbi:TonB-dependent receptor [Aureibacter tunicatorum]|uniref:TonB-dependent receptor plug domain-containing protein n=1 Tax=Aureibacter tunicatorum TaxID=866807 RepID=A0AAE3XJB0_9BACT|nr:TonB-dependent receptor [Aureibacter tunicatorum]MDR6237917.1 hypothetical protein [Aureibacter tunicatorum]BDD02950.1 TonB-dependent receptor [Aureibacter tunicatorum]
MLNFSSIAISFIFFLLSFSVNESFAQILIKGKIIDKKGEAIPGANVMLKNTYDGASSSLNGTYQFTTEAKGEEILICSFIGYEPFEKIVILKEKTIEVNIVLIEAWTKLDAVQISAGTIVEVSERKQSVKLSKRDILTTPGTMGDLVAGLMAVSGTQRAEDDGRIFVRGGDARETQTYVDGIRVANPYASKIPDVPMRSRFSANMSKGLVFSSGGFSAEYGDALSGAVILETNDLPEQSQSSLHLMTVGFGGMHNQRFDSSALMVDANYVNLHPIYQINKPNADFKKAPESYASNLAYRKIFKNSALLKFNTSIGGGKMSLNRLDIEDSLKLKLYQADNQFLFSQATYKQAWNDSWEFFAGLGYGADVNDMQWADEVFEKIVSHNLQAKIKLTNDLSRSITWIAGLELTKANYDFDTQLTEEKYSQQRTLSLSSGFGEFTYSPTKNFTTRIGGRIEYDHQSNRALFSPRFGIASKLSENAQMSFSSGIFTQMPDANDLRVNPELKLERAWHYILNYQYENDGKFLRIEPYYKSYSDMVRFEERYDQGTYNNFGDGHAYGVDLFWKDKGSIKNSEYWVSYSFVNAERLVKNYNEHRVPWYGAKHTANVVYKYFVNAIDTQFGATYWYSSGRPYYEPQKDGDFLEKYASPNHGLNINASYLTNVFGHFTVVHAAINNVLGLSQDYGYQYSSDPYDDGEFVKMKQGAFMQRNFFLGVFIQFEK